MTITHYIFDNENFPIAREPVAVDRSKLLETVILHHPHNGENPETTSNAMIYDAYRERLSNEIVHYQEIAARMHVDAVDDEPTYPERANISREYRADASAQAVLHLTALVDFEAAIIENIRAHQR